MLLDGHDDADADGERPRSLGLEPLEPFNYLEVLDALDQGDELEDDEGEDSLLFGGCLLGTRSLGR